MSKPILQVHDLCIEFVLEDRTIEAVKGATFELAAGETLAIVGESGSGKSVTALALTRLLPVPPALIKRGEILFRGENVMAMDAAQLRKLRGGKIAYIFQEPSTSLNPVYTVRSQIGEAIRLHRPDVTDVDAEIVRWLDAVGIVDAARRMHDYPHQLSGGMQQRVMIAMALACQPDVLVADEPTTALDVTIQAQIMDLLGSLKERFGMSIILITHNFGIVSGFASRVLVMYRGKIVEQGSTAEVLEHPRHPYTRALIDCIPRLGSKQNRLKTIDHAAIGAA
ncbi:MAG: ABC transporter ATP-binding protein [Chthoniobacterales bacterium]|nr:ABC transporter ATP-binding protein [Chthoniobacterales bacterium]